MSLISAPEQPFGPGALCGNCGHMAMRHDEKGCHGVDPAVGCRFGSRGTEARPHKCSAFLWNGIRWPRPWESSGYEQEKKK